MTNDDIEFTIECTPEDMPIRGNCIASGDDKFDEECARQIEADWLGSDWAWCVVKVTGQWMGLSAVDYLGGCNYRDQADFEKCDYYDAMKTEIHGLIQTQCNAIKATA